MNEYGPQTFVSCSNLFLIYTYTVTFRITHV